MRLEAVAQSRQLAAGTRLVPNVPIVRLTLAKGMIKANQKDAARKEREVLAQLSDKFPAHDEMANRLI